MDRAITPAFLVVSLVCAACGDTVQESADAEAGGTTTAGPGTTTDSDPLPPKLTQDCDSQVFVGRVEPGHTCLDLGAWTASALGDTGILTEFCEYTWVGGGEPDLAGLPGEDDGVRGLVESCPRVVPQADPFSLLPALRVSLHDAFMKTIGKIPLASFVGEPRPRLYIVDTIPESLLTIGLQPNDPHGFQMRELTEGILCDTPAACAASVVNALGLPRVTPVLVDLERGGTHGSLMDLARGIDVAVEDWEARGDAAHLVLALAVGWEPLDKYGPPPKKSLDDLLAIDGAATDLQAVLAALTRASCHGAFIVAAVGNATGEPCAQTGAVGPAFLQSLDAPSPAQCDVAGFDHKGLTNDVVPFLLAAAHIGLAGQSLANVRTDAPAGIKAQGSAFSNVKGDSALLTGSSVATSVGAAAAAALWAVYPGLSRTDVLASLKDSAEGATGLSICRALESACDRLDAKNCIDLTCPSPEFTDGAVAQVVDAISAALDPPPCNMNDAACRPPKRIDIDKFPGSQPSVMNACGTSTTVWSATPLPAVTAKPTTQWTAPQPKKPFCPTCLAELTTLPKQKLTIGLSLASKPKNSYPLLIEVETATGIEQYPIDPETLADDDIVNLVTIEPAPPWSAVRSVRLSYFVEDADGGVFLESEPLLLSTGRCGNGRIEGHEACDNGKNNGDGCEPDCTLTPSRCGNGIVEFDEACDDGDPEAGDGCEPDCTLTPSRCGNGIDEFGEACDDGNDNAGDGCEPDCTLTPSSCGNGIQEGDEACDDGNQDKGDGCEPDCTVTPAICGNNIVEAGEVCDDGNTDDGDKCSADCLTETSPQVCGDGTTQDPEVCDDGNLENGDGCEADCTPTPAECGNGIIENGEVCDDGNDINGGMNDFCKNDCTVFVPPSCQAPPAYVVCDDMIDLADKTDKTNALKAMGICDDLPSNSIQYTDFTWGGLDADQPDNPIQPSTWQVARGFGSYTYDADMDPKTPDALLYSPREGDAFLMLSTGVIKAPNMQGVVIENVNSQVNSGNNNNPDLPDAMPLPMHPIDGSNNGAGGKPFQDCDGVNDCSDTLQFQWEDVATGNPDDKLWFTFKTKVPAGTFGYKFDFVFCSSEWPVYVNSAFNDLLVAWQVDPSADDPNQDPPVDPYTGNVTFIPDPNDPTKSLPLTITALDPYYDGPGYTQAEPQLAGTGFESHACSDWFTAKGSVQPGADLEIGFFLTDMGDSLLATVALLDNFRWDCEGCIPSDVDDCGVQLPP